MAIQTEIWTGRIEANLFKGQEFVNMATNHDGFVENLAVNIPQAGAVPTVEKNRSVFPAVITERTDDVLRYLMANYTTNPIRVKNIDQLQTSYDKVDAILNEHTAQLGERIGDECAFAWSPTGGIDKILRTTGSALATNLPNGTATGTRNTLVKGDIKNLAKGMDNENVSQLGRKLLLPVEMYYELFNDAELLSIDNLPTQSLPDGVITRLFGFDIMIRSSVNLYDNVLGSGAKTIGSAEAITDCHGALAWSEFSVCKAQGETNTWINEKVAEHFGDIMSAEVQFGASKMRTDGKGVFALAQGYNA